MSQYHERQYYQEYVGYGKRNKIEVLPLGTLIREVCYDGFEVTWKIESFSNNGVFTLTPHIVPEFERVNNWQCGYQKLNTLLKEGNERGNTFTIVNETHFEEDLFTL